MARPRTPRPFGLPTTARERLIAGVPRRGDQVRALLRPGLLLRGALLVALLVGAPLGVGAIITAPPALDAVGVPTYVQGANLPIPAGWRLVRAEYGDPALVAYIPDRATAAGVRTPSITVLSIAVPEARRALIDVTPTLNSGSDLDLIDALLACYLGERPATIEEFQYGSSTDRDLLRAGRLVRLTAPIDWSPDTRAFDRFRTIDPGTNKEQIAAAAMRPPHPCATPEGRDLRTVVPEPAKSPALEPDPDLIGEAAGAIEIRQAWVLRGAPAEARLLLLTVAIPADLPAAEVEALERVFLTLIAGIRA
jgi:hypothetical protein